MSLLKVQALKKVFGGLVALDDLSFDVRSGAIVGLIGPNGAGKTTVFNLISGFLLPDTGQIIFEGQKITGKKPHEISTLGIARTFQIAKPFTHLSVVDNVMVGCLSWSTSFKEAHQQAHEILEQVNLSRKAQQLSLNLNVPERKRLEVARALSIKPKVLLLDEVMSGLNAKETQDLIATIRNIRDHGATILLIEHVMRAVMSLAESIVVLNHGLKIMEGTPDEVGKNEKVIEAYLGARYSVT